MELRQRSQRPSEPTDQSASSHHNSGNTNTPSWNHHQRQTSENSMAYNRPYASSTGSISSNAPPPPPPPPNLRSSVPLVQSSPMFHNPNAYSQQQQQQHGSMRNLSSSVNSVGSFNSSTPSMGSPLNNQRYPQRQSSYHHPSSYTAPPAMKPPAYGRSHTEPFYQGDAIANSTGGIASPHVSRGNYGQSFGSNGMNTNAGGYNNDSYASSGGYGYNSNNMNNSGSMNNLTSTNKAAPNPYKAQSNKPSKLLRFVTSFMYLSIVLLGSSSLYFRRAIKITSNELEEAHKLAHRHHLSNTKKTGGRHGGGAEESRKNQQAEIRRITEKNAELQKQIDEKSSEYQGIKRRYDQLYGSFQGLDATKQNMLKAIDHETHDVESLEEEKEEHEAMLNGKEQLDAVVLKRETALWDRVEKLSGLIGRESARENVDWFQKDYGEGPYKVEIELSYPFVPAEDHPNPQSWKRIRKWIVIELAPLDLMPHAVNMFMRQVHHKMWENQTLKFKDARKMQFGPQTGTVNERKFSMKFSNLLYQEYSEDYPHHKWTVGYAGRPAGPDFFINFMDNRQEYGPKGDKHAEADPCFGKIVEGFEILERIAMIPEYMGCEDEGLKALYEVKILGAFLIKPRHLKQQAAEAKLQQQADTMAH